MGASHQAVPISGSPPRNSDGLVGAHILGKVDPEMGRHPNLKHAFDEKNLTWQVVMAEVFVGNPCFSSSGREDPQPDSDPSQFWLL